MGSEDEENYQRFEIRGDIKVCDIGILDECLSALNSKFLNAKKCVILKSVGHLSF